MAEIDNKETQDAADALHHALARVMETAPPWVIEEINWEDWDEDCVRDAFRSLHWYGRWRLTGQTNIMFVSPDTDVGRVHADHLALAAGDLSGDYDYLDGWTIADEEKKGLRRALALYVSLRRREGGGLFRY